jgi:hypothetical protein
MILPDLGHALVYMSDQRQVAGNNGPAVVGCPLRLELHIVVQTSCTVYSRCRWQALSISSFLCQSKRTAEGERRLINFQTSARQTSRTAIRPALRPHRVVRLEGGWSGYDLGKA